MVEMQMSPRPNIAGGTSNNLLMNNSDPSGEIGSSLIQQREASFRLSDSEKSALSNKIKSQRSTLASQEVNLSEKMKTIIDVFKKIDRKIVKNERLTPLMEKKTQP